MIRSWESLRSTSLVRGPVFNLRLDQRRSPRTGQAHDFYIIEAVNWVNVVAITSAREIVMIEQFRHATNTVELEIPGGTIDGTDVSPLNAGVRELAEETGYTGREACVIGEVFPNPAILTNRCYTVGVLNCVRSQTPKLDAGEDILTRLVPITEIAGLVRSGVIRHSLVVAALYYFDLWWGSGPSA